LIEEQSGKVKIIALIMAVGRSRKCSLIQTSVSFASFFLTAPFGGQMSTAILDASPIKMMQDYPLHV
jgi:hypothetical protein